MDRPASTGHSGSSRRTTAGYGNAQTGTNAIRRWWKIELSELEVIEAKSNHLKADTSKIAKSRNVASTMFCLDLF